MGNVLKFLLEYSEYIKDIDNSDHNYMYNEILKLLNFLVGRRSVEIFYKKVSKDANIKKRSVEISFF